MKTVWVFPGQGSQSTGMGLDLLTIGRDKFNQAEEILGWPVAPLLQGDSSDLSQTLSQTQYTQPCLYLISAILTDLLKARGLTPTLVAGHSLGEYTALYCAGVFDFATGLELVKQRSLLMSEAKIGAMTALIGFDRAKLEETIATTENVVMANDNSAEQVVISGTVEAVQSICDRLKVKRAIPLAVSGAFHSPLMSEAAAKFAEILSKVELRDAQVPVLSNVEPNEAATSAQVIGDRLQRQMTSPVRWREICLYLASSSYERAIEVGAGKVLTGLIKRTAPGLQLVNVSSLEQAEAIASSTVMSS